MEKLSIEQKAERYDKALKVTKDNLYALAEIIETGAETVNIQSVENCFYRAFPELKENKESEDEKIRGAIIHFISHTPTVPKGIIGKEIMITWLKKQGEHQKFIDAIQMGDRVTRNKNGALINLSQLKRVAKPADNVKPKFHEGDWVVFNNHPEKGSIYQVEKIENYEYTLRHFLGGSMPLSFSHENMIRLWTVEDALEGDVLAYNDGSLTIFGNRLNGLDSGLYMAHVVLTDKIEFRQTCTIKDVKPAAKEQRDILFAKLKEAGYEWYAKKKELKKIEQKPIELGGNEDKQRKDISIQINPSEYINDMGGNGCYLKNTTRTSTWSKADEEMLRRCIIATFVHGYSKESDWLKFLKDRVQQQPKQEWSEKDEKLIDEVILLIENGALDSDGKTYYIEKLKSLKDRTRPKQEWGEEDEEMWLDSIKYLELFDAQGIHGNIAVPCINWLKNLKERVQPQPKKEWSEEDEANLNAALSYIKDDALKEFIKSLRPQKYWKPSEEQLKSLEIACDRNDRVGFDLTQLLKELKKLYCYENK